MQRNATLEKIEKQAERLTPQEQLRLVDKLIHQLTRAGLTQEKPLDWSKLYGLGKGLWKGNNAQEYVNKLREERE